MGPKSARQRAVKQFAGLSGTDEDLLYECSFVLDPRSPAPEIQFEDYPGLVQYHVLEKGSARDRLVCYWLDENHFRAHAHRLQHHAGLSQPAHDGTLIRICIKPKEFWQRYSIQGIILAIAALFGALSAIRNYFAEIFVGPEITVAYTDASALDVVEDAQIVVPMSIINQVRFIPVSVRLQKAEAVAKSDLNSVQKLQCDVPALVLAPSQPTTFKLQGIAPKLSGANQGLPETYNLTVVVGAKAGIIPGWIWGWIPFKPLSRQIKVWPAHAVLDRPHIVRVQNNSCQVQGTLYPGKPYQQGMQAEFTAFSPHGDLVHLEAWAGGTSDPQNHTAPGLPLDTFKASFKTAPLDKFQPYKYTLVLQSAHDFGTPQCEQYIADPRKLRITFQ
jgi:hypothetical protein